MRRLLAFAQTLNRKFKKEQQGIVIGNNLAALSDAFWQSFSCCRNTGLFIYVLCVCECVCVRVYLLLCLNHMFHVAMCTKIILRSTSLCARMPDYSL